MLLAASFMLGKNGVWCVVENGYGKLRAQFQGQLVQSNAPGRVLVLVVVCGCVSARSKLKFAQ